MIIDEIKKSYKKIIGNIKIYIFSLGNDTFDEEFDNYENVSVEPVPQPIISTYKEYLITKMILKNFQIKAINKLIENTRELLNSSTNSNIIFKSPTGSGKTIMVAEFIHRITKDKISNRDICFIWAGPRRTLTDQSKEKLIRYLNKFKDLKCSSFLELQNNEILENEILFLNWESINKKNKSTIVVENEREFF